MKKILLPVAILATIVLAGCTMNGTDDSDAMMNNDAMTNTSSNSSMNNDDAMSNDDSMMNDDDGVMVGGAMMVRSKDIVDNAVMSQDHTTLVAAVKAAGLVETLKSKGPFTVFAPTNAAFAKLPAGTVDNLLMPANKAMLTSILTYHVVAGAYTSKDMKDGMKLKTVQGEEITITSQNNMWYVNGVKVDIADVISSNGVTHVVGTVLMPASMMQK